MTSLDTLSNEPYDVLAALRSRAPVAYVASLGGWVVVDHATAVEVMRNAATFTVDDPRFTTGQVIGPSMLSLDGAAHSRHRTPFVEPYRPRALERSAATWIDERASELVAALPRDDRVDLRTRLAAPLAAETVLMTLAIAADPEHAIAWYHDIVGAVTDLSAGLEMPPWGPAAFHRLLTAVSATPGSDSEVIERARATLSEPEVAANVAVVMFGAIETTEGAIANLFWHLLTTDTFEKVRHDRSLLPAAIEESLRLEPAAARIDRYATRDVALGEVTIRKGDLVIVSLTAANRDPAIFDEPDAFRLDRTNPTRHLTFARGPHTCLGAHLARLEMAATANAAFDGAPNLQFMADESAGPHGLVFRKPQRIVVSIES